MIGVFEIDGHLYALTGDLHPVSKELEDEFAGRPLNFAYIFCMGLIDREGPLAREQDTVVKDHAPADGVARGITAGLVHTKALEGAYVPEKMQHEIELMRGQVVEMSAGATAFGGHPPADAGVFQGFGAVGL